MSAAIAKPANPSANVDPKSAPLKEIPDVLVDPRTMKRYARGRFLGKGGFAKCYEITDMETKQVFAGKIVPKSLILKQHQREKMTSEIAIHKSLNHANVVGFHGFFEDDDFVFVVLEICRRRSLLELHKRRKAVTEPEARYYMTQLLKGVHYLHNNRVIHRDLKLGNIFLNDDMELKIAPTEMYTLLVGKPPFETSCLKETYNRIKKNNYTIPWHINPLASNLIKRMLHAEPAQRPTIAELEVDEYFTTGYIPVRLPTTCLTLPPRFSIAPTTATELSQRRPLTAINNQAGTEHVGCHLPRRGRGSRMYSHFWISKWVDYSDKYGLGYQLCDNSVGVLFNDYTRLMMYTDGDSLQYIDKTATESYLSARSFPSALNKKITLLKYFRNYMSEHLLKAGANMARRDGDELARLPYLSLWFRTKSAIVLHLTNGTVQINFFLDHTKLILCPLMNAVTYIDEKREFRTYKLSLLEEFGCTKELASRLRYAKLMVEKLMDSKPSPAAQ
ncbi:Serine/threonine-protein kinase PLK1 [Dissostichus eleginoides]|uniref:Serine/threonine-protein kinase PLK n=1 Tax=Dissostichus eleginoides TaxID=100907 RepID=A0AAD9BKR6_DISEL|nr:Serine/threonine-protein kinase PLK1 [Dissostichus eleginoides]